MGRAPLRPLLGGLAVLVAAWACTERPDPYPDPWADADLDADGDGDLDAEEDAEEDAAPEDSDLASDPGPITLVAHEGGLTTARLCDLDGDGDLDNSVADLGTSAAELAVMAMNSLIQGGIEDEERFVLHIPWVDDRAGPADDAAVMINFGGIDEDVPPDISDDFLGGEGFWARAGALDACGEPRYHIDPVRIDDGVVSGDSGTLLFPLFDQILIRGAGVMGTIEPGGLSAELELCAYAAIPDIGASPGLEEADDLTMLEVFLAGGDAFGVPMVPGFTPDVDLDHDGLESFVLDADLRISQCVDGDLTTIAGRECWRDPRMVDGFSLNMQLLCVHAEFLGRAPGWEGEVEGTCDEPPERSLFDPG